MQLFFLWTSIIFLTVFTSYFDITIRTTRIIEGKIGIIIKQIVEEDGKQEQNIKLAFLRILQGLLYYKKCMISSRAANLSDLISRSLMN